MITTNKPIAAFTAEPLPGIDLAARFAVSEAVHPFEVVMKAAAFPVRGRPAKSLDKFATLVYWNTLVSELYVMLAVLVLWTCGPNVYGAWAGAARIKPSPATRAGSRNKFLTHVFKNGFTDLEQLLDLILF